MLNYTELGYTMYNYILQHENFMDAMQLAGSYPGTLKFITMIVLQAIKQWCGYIKLCSK